MKGLVRVTGGTAKQMVMYAYNLDSLLRHDPEPVGGPPWVDDERFDVVARGPVDLSFAQSREMLLSLLVIDGVERVLPQGVQPRQRNRAANPEPCSLRPLTFDR